MTSVEIDVGNAQVWSDLVAALPPDVSIAGASAADVYRTRIIVQKVPVYDEETGEQIGEEDGPSIEVPEGDSIGYLVTLPAEAAVAVKTLLKDPVGLRKATLMRHMSDVRRIAEYAGTVVDGLHIDTDERSQLKVFGAAMAADRDENWTTMWAGRHPVDAAGMKAISNAVQEHINGTFQKASDIRSKIESGKITKEEQIDAAFFG